MTQTLLLVILFVAVIGTLPWLVRRLQQRRVQMLGSAAAAPRVVGAIAVGPHQRVVTVEIGEPNRSITLVLGVTAQSICCLHTMEAATEASKPATALQTTGFDIAMAQARSADRADAEV